MRARLEQLWIQLVDFVRAQPPARRIVLATTGVGSLVVVLGLAWWVQRPLYRPLFTNLAEQDASAIVEALRATDDDLARRVGRALEKRGAGHGS